MGLSGRWNAFYAVVSMQVRLSGGGVHGGVPDHRAKGEGATAPVIARLLQRSGAADTKARRPVAIPHDPVHLSRAFHDRNPTLPAAPAFATAAISWSRPRPAGHEPAGTTRPCNSLIRSSAGPIPSGSRSRSGQAEPGGETVRHRQAAASRTQRSGITAHEPLLGQGRD